MRLSNYHINLGKLFLVLALLLIAPAAWGATYYVAKVGGTQWKYLENAWPTAGTGTNTTNLETASGSVGANNTMVIAAGSYAAATDLSTTSWYVSSAGQTIRAAVSSDPGFSTYGGAVILDGTGLTYTMEVGEANITISGITFRKTDATDQYTFYAWATPTILNDCIIENGARSILLEPMTLEITLNRCTIRNNFNDARGATLNNGTTATFNYCLIYNNCADIYVGAATANFNNCVFAGQWGSYGVIRTGGVTSVINVSNCIFTGNNAKVGISTSQIISNSDSATVTVKNSILQKHPTDPSNYGYQNITDGGGNTYLSPKLTKQYGGGGYVAIGTDEDYHTKAAASVFTRMADYAYSKGIRVYVALEYLGNYTAQDWAELAVYAAQGHELCNHTKYHMSGTAVQTGIVTVDGPANGTVSISVNRVSAYDSSTWTGTMLLKEGGSTVKTIDISYSQLASTGSWLGLVNSIKSQAGWTASNSTYDGTPSVLLADQTDLAVASATTLPVDVDRWMHADYVEGSKLIKDNTGYEPRTIVYPGGVYDATMYHWLKDQDNWTPLGLTAPLGARVASLSEGSWTRFSTDFVSGPGSKAGCQIWVVSSPQLSVSIGTSNITQYTDGMLDWLGHIGGNMTFYTHGTDDYSLANLQTFIDALAANSSVTVMTPGQMFARIRAEATDADSDGLRWLVTETDNANYRPLAGSPAIDAGTPILTYAEWIAAGGDAAGKNPTAGKFSIGAYQYQARKPTGDFPALPIWTSGSKLNESLSTDAGSYVQP